MTFLAQLAMHIIFHHLRQRYIIQQLRISQAMSMAFNKFDASERKNYSIYTTFQRIVDEIYTIPTMSVAKFSLVKASQAQVHFLVKVVACCCCWPSFFAVFSPCEVQLGMGTDHRRKAVFPSNCEKPLLTEQNAKYDVCAKRFL